MREVRYTPSEFELRGVRGEGATLSGYAAVFDSPTEIGGRFLEVVSPRAFNKTLKEGDVRALFNHDPNIVLGRTRSKTLRLAADDHGLAYEVDLPDTQQARDLWTSIERGDVSQSSFAFEVQKQTLTQPTEENGLPTRTLNAVRLYDVSAVTYPAYEDTEVQARAVFATFAAELETIVAPEADEDSAATTAEQAADQPEAFSATPQQEPEQGLSIFIARLAIKDKQGRSVS